MKHIVIDARIINSSTGRYVERLLHYLQKIDTVNRYSVLIRPKDISSWNPTNKNFHIVESDISDYSFSEQFTLRKQLDNLKPDLVHFCMPQQPLLYNGKTVTTFHDLSLLKTWNSDKNWFIYHLKQLVGRLAFLIIIRKTSHIITPSKYTMNDLVDFSNISKEKITVTYESADINSDTITPYPVPFKKFILYVGQQSDYKNIKRLGEAHQKLLKDNPNLGLVLVGRKKKDVINNERYFTSKKYKNIHFTDFIPDEQRDWLYKHCEAYIFPSLMEGFGLPGLEAMGYGAPVVSSNTTCLPEVYGDAAMYFNPNSTDDMVKTIHHVLNNKKLREKLVKNGYKQLTKYSWKKMAQQTHAIYMKALK